MSYSKTNGFTKEIFKKVAYYISLMKHHEIALELQRLEYEDDSITDIEKLIFKSLLLKQMNKIMYIIE